MKAKAPQAQGGRWRARAARRVKAEAAAAKAWGEGGGDARGTDAVGGTSGGTATSARAVKKTREEAMNAVADALRTRKAKNKGKKKKLQSWDAAKRGGTADASTAGTIARAPKYPAVGAKYSVGAKCAAGPKYATGNPFAALAGSRR